MLRKLKDLSSQELFLFLFTSFLIIALGFIAAYQFVEPSPPRTIAIAAGPKGGAYYQYANTYKSLLKQEGVDLIVHETGGAVENIRLLEAGSQSIDVAFVQGGVGRRSGSREILSIGSLYYEPLWPFARKGLPLTSAADLKGLTLAVGAPSSGTRVLAMDILALNGITEENTRIISVDAEKSAEMLINGEVDMAYIVSTHWAVQVQRLIQHPEVFLVGFERAEALAMHLRYLSLIRIPQGLADFEKNIPDQDLTLVAPTAQLAVRSGLHPALIDLLLQTARKVHFPGGVLEAEGEFPSPRYLDFPLSEEARRFYSEKTPFLQRYFPFWVATLLSRIKVMILPFIAIVFPLFKLMPFLYRWRMRSRVYRWYADLGRAGAVIQSASSEKDLAAAMARLDEIESSVAAIKVPDPFAENLFHLQMHIDMFRRKLREKNQRD